MKKLLIALALLPSLLFGAAAYDVPMTQRNAANTANTQVTIAPAINSLLGFDASKGLINITAGTNVTISGGTISASGGGGGGGNVNAVGTLASNALVIGQGSTDVATTTTGTGVLTALGINVGSAGAFLTFNGNAGTPSALVGTNISGTGASFTAGAATILATTRTIGGSNFNGSANVTSFPSPGAIGGTTPAAGAFTTLSATGVLSTTDATEATSSVGSIVAAGGISAAKKVFGTQFNSTIATGTAPLVVASTTNVANLNASSLSGATFAAPGAIGGGTPGSGAFTTLSATGHTTFEGVTSTGATGTGNLVYSASPTLTGTATIGTVAATTVNATNFTFGSSSGPLITSSGTVSNPATLDVTLGGTGRATGTTAYGLVAAGTTATGAQQTLAAGATTEVLVGGGASALPVWTTATGSGAPVRGTSPAFTTAFTLANGTSPTTGAVAVTAFDTDAWAASRGAIQIYDGTANTYVVATLASDTPSNGQVPVWNTGGTITWETPSGSGNVTAAGTLTSNDLVIGQGTTAVATSSTAAGILTFLGTPSSANLAAAVTNETGSGALVFGTSPAFTTAFTLANGTSPTTGAVAVTAFDTDAWAASHGAIQIHDGTANTYVVATLASDTPSNGQVPVWNTGGTITWETPSGSGNVTAAGTLANNAIMIGQGTTATATTTTGTGVLTALGVNTGSAGAFQVNNASGASLTSLTAANISTGALANGMTATTQSAADNSTKLATTAYADRVGQLVEKIATFVIDGGGSAITTGTVSGTSTIPYACTLTGWSISATAATGTNTIKIWNTATGTAIPTISNVINTSGVSLTTGTNVKSTTISDFTDTSYAAYDMFRCAVTAVDGAATDITVTLYGTRN